MSVEELIMPSMKMNLRGLFNNVARSIPICDGRDQYAACLEEVLRHLEETIRGEHSLQEFAEHYCLATTAEQSRN